MILRKIPKVSLSVLSGKHHLICHRFIRVKHFYSLPIEIMFQLCLILILKNSVFFNNGKFEILCVLTHVSFYSYATFMSGLHNSARQWRSIVNPINTCVPQDAPVNYKSLNIFSSRKIFARFKIRVPS